VCFALSKVVGELPGIPPGGGVGDIGIEWGPNQFGPVTAQRVHLCVASAQLRLTSQKPCAKLLDKWRIYLYFNALHIDWLGLVPPAHLG
jgi:hypothetical protein